MRMKTVIAAMLLASVTGMVWADTHIYDGSTAWSNWNVAADWSPDGLPEEGDWAYVDGDRRVYVTDQQTGLKSVFAGNSSSGYIRVYGAPNYDFYSGHLGATNIYIGYGANAGGFIQQMGGTVTTDRIHIKAAAGSEVAGYYLQGGTLNAARQDIGTAGKGAFNHSAGTNNAETVYVGLFNYASLGANSDVAYYNLTGGTLNVTTNLNVGTFSTGRGHIKLGDQTGETDATGTIAGTGNLSIKTGNVAAVGIVQGFGNVNLTGVLTNSGKVIADGWGGVNTSDRTLSMVNFSSISVNEATISADSGWYAVNKGKLILPGVAVAATGTAFFGEDAAGTQNLVNSMKIDSAGVNGGNLAISLLASDHSDLADVEGNLIGVWDIDGSAFDFGTGSVNLAIKYDAAMAASLGLTEGDLKLYHNVNGAWVDATASVDTANDIITATSVDSFSMFAVGTEVVPEPATMSLIGIGALAMLAKRNRK